MDVIFPVLHGTFGEDGTIQGLLELADIPYVGAGVLGSAAGMDKDIMKSLFIAAGIPIVKHVTILRSEWETDPKKVEKLVDEQTEVSGVREAGKSRLIGRNHKAHNRNELGPAIDEAAKFDRKIVIEEGVGGNKAKAREIECSVLGNDEPASIGPGRDRAHQRVLRLQRQVSGRRLGTDHSRQAHQGANQKSPGDGHAGVPSGRLLRSGPRRFPNGPEDAAKFI